MSGIPTEILEEQQWLAPSNCSEGLKTVQVSLKANNVKEVDGSGILEEFR